MGSHGSAQYGANGNEGSMEEISKGTGMHGAYQLSVGGQGDVGQGNKWVGEAYDRSVRKPGGIGYQLSIGKQGDMGRSVRRIGNREAWG